MVSSPSQHKALTYLRIGNFSLPTDITIEVVHVVILFATKY
jgi:hypothetical protein